MSITENRERIGNFTSSEIFRLMGTPAVRDTYIEEKQLEIDMDRCISTEAYSKSMAWGTFLESYVFSLQNEIGMEYQLTSTESDPHPTIKGWAGSKDLIVPGVKISDIKCYQPKKFGKYARAIEKQSVEVLRDKFKKEYWQLVSNAIINKTPRAEAVCFMPYENELAEIRVMAENYEGADMWKYKFIVDADKSELAYLPNTEKCKFKNLNKFEFEVPLQDIASLTDAVKKAIELRDAA